MDISGTNHTRTEGKKVKESEEKRKKHALPSKELLKRHLRYGKNWSKTKMKYSRLSENI